MSFRCVSELVAPGIFVFSFSTGENRHADIHSKHWGYSSVWHMIHDIILNTGAAIDSKQF